MVALVGKALSWYQWWEKCNPNPTWEGFKLAAITKFQPSMIQNPFNHCLLLSKLALWMHVEEFDKYVGALRTIGQEFVK